MLDTPLQGVDVPITWIVYPPHLTEVLVQESPVLVRVKDSALWLGFEAMWKAEAHLSLSPYGLDLPWELTVWYEPHHGAPLAACWLDPSYTVPPSAAAVEEVKALAHASPPP